MEISQYMYLYGIMKIYTRGVSGTFFIDFCIFLNTEYLNFASLKEG